MEFGLRKVQMDPLSVKIQSLKKLAPIAKKHLLEMLKKRFDRWGLYLEGDLLDRWMDMNKDEYIQKAIGLEKRYALVSKKSWRRLIKNIWNDFVAHPYQLIFRYFIEKSCG